MNQYRIWLVGCFEFTGPLRQYFSLYRAVSQREGERGERIEESKNVQTTHTRTYCKRNRPLPYYHPNCRTPRHWKFTQDHRTTRPPPRINTGNIRITDKAFDELEMRIRQKQRIMTLEDSWDVKHIGNTGEKENHQLKAE